MDNILRKNLVDQKNVLLPPLHIKLGLMKQFVKALPKDGRCFKYLYQKFPHLSEAKLKEGVLGLYSSLIGRMESRVTLFIRNLNYELTC